LLGAGAWRRDFTLMTRRSGPGPRGTLQCGFSNRTHSTLRLTCANPPERFGCWPEKPVGAPPIGFYRQRVQCEQEGLVSAWLFVWITVVPTGDARPIQVRSPKRPIHQVAARQPSDGKATCPYQLARHPKEERHGLLHAVFVHRWDLPQVLEASGAKATLESQGGYSVKAFRVATALLASTRIRTLEETSVACPCLLL